jgi:hypothetical protein
MGEALPGHIKRGTSRPSVCPWRGRRKWLSSPLGSKPSVFGVRFRRENFRERARPFINKEEEKMEKLFIVGMALILAFSLAGLTLGQEKTKKEEQKEVGKPAVEKLAVETKAPEAKEKEKAEVKKEITQKSSVWRAGGMVTAVDPKGKTLSIHQETVHHNRTLKLEVSAKVANELANLKPGDFIDVWITGRTVTALNKVS